MSRWYVAPGNTRTPTELRHHDVAGLRVLPGGAGAALRLLVLGPVRRPAAVVRTVAGEAIHLDAYETREWIEAGRARTPDDAYQIGVGALAASDMVADARRELEVRERDRQRGYSRDRDADRGVVRELRARLDDPARVVHALGLGRGARRQAGGGLLILCPAPDHEDRTPSCSVRRGRDGTIQVKCHGCQWSADALGLIAVVNGLSPRRDFRRVLERAAELAGVSLARRCA